ncbi:hypothetical protein UFOVP325_76 [uncultured Caudovirales phage]|uniref:Uncharacterized protein n=1 Tax=uncultured Caudovirales phage TaxID=2100421 RepID=A0A6J5MSJ8_9CAUD|nr:hypothetical protein UFOVP325_76 [uncultured Caudovirales phage]CAB4148006.1 hypothetical protein UFOVP430_71 [uncultured Caudovirales phage]
MADSYRERLAKKAQAHKELTERDPEKLKQWYELAGEAAEDPDKEIQSSARDINASRKERKVAASAGRSGGGGFDENDIVPEAGEAIVVRSNRNLKPLTPLGPVKHRKIYAVAEAAHQARLAGRSSVEPHEEEQYGKEWDSLPDDAKHAWQQTPHGKKATADALSQYEAERGSVLAQPEARENMVRSREKTRKILKAGFSDNENSLEKFKSSGQLLDADGNHERDWRQGWKFVNITSKLQVGTRAAKIIEGKAIHTDPQHHQNLSDHIDELVNRSSSSAPAHLQGNQFNVKDGSANAAKESLARSAMAHAFGMKDKAIEHFRAAVSHAGDLAQAVHGVNSQPLGDWDKQGDIESKYVKSINEVEGK